jgi:drug/metabolite transporter (DMT)-like permease
LSPAVPARHNGDPAPPSFRESEEALPSPVHPPASPRAWLLFGVVCLVFSTTWLAIRIGLEDLPPLGAAGLRYAIAFPILLTITLARRVRWPRGMVEWRIPLLLGVTMFTIPFALIYYGEKTVPSGLASILFASYAMFTALFAHFFLHDERFSAMRIAGVVVGFTGVVVVFWERVAGHHSWLGEAALVLTAAIQGTSTILVRRTRPPVPALVLSTIGTCTGALLLLAASALFEGDLFARLTLRGAISIGYLAIFGSVIAFTTSIHLTHVLGANRIASTVYITPTLAVVWGALFLGEPVGAYLLLGGALVVVGVWLTHRAAVATS